MKPSMAPLLLAGAVGALIALAATRWFQNDAAPHGSPSKEAAAGEVHPPEEPRVRVGTNGEVTVHLDIAVQKRMGLEVAAAATRSHAPALQAFGRILDPMPLAQASQDVSLARAALDASRLEAGRAHRLFEKDRNTSARNVELADLALQRDELAAQAARLRWLSAAGLALGSRTDLPTLLEKLVQQEAALARLDVPGGEPATATPARARLEVAGNEATLGEAVYVGAAPTADPLLPGRGFLFLLPRRSPPPGTALTAWIEFGEATSPQVLVPRSALLRHAGQVFVEVRTEDDAFTRRAVTLGHPVDEGWLILSGLAEGEWVVIQGAQQILSEENRGPGGAD